jgi:protein involved in temperature-dependent protein secretion
MLRAANARAEQAEDREAVLRSVRDMEEERRVAAEKRGDKAEARIDEAMDILDTIYCEGGNSDSDRRLRPVVEALRGGAE